MKELGPDYPYNVDVREILYTWEHHKEENILTYRDRSFPSKYTGQGWSVYIIITFI